MNYFDQIFNELKKGTDYADLLSDAVWNSQKYSKHANCASFADLALQCGRHSQDDELAIRGARMFALRELDRAAGASREEEARVSHPMKDLRFRKR